MDFEFQQRRRARARAQRMRADMERMRHDAAIAFAVFYALLMVVAAIV